jgi:hypothetical protein
MNKHTSLSTRERVAKHRAALRAQGLRPKQIWVPDLRLPEVRERIRREAAAIAAADAKSDDMAFIESISIWNELPDNDIPEFDDR